MKQKKNIFLVFWKKINENYLRKKIKIVCTNLYVVQMSKETISTYYIINVKQMNNSEVEIQKLIQWFRLKILCIFDYFGTKRKYFHALYGSRLKINKKWTDFTKLGHLDVTCMHWILGASLIFIWIEILIFESSSFNSIRFNLNPKILFIIPQI